jgi:predicted nucleic acid-binding protein
MTVFVDTNVLVYARDAAQGAKQRMALEWMAALWETGKGRLSVQVLHEYYVTVTRKLDPGMPVTDARDDVQALRSWSPVPLDGDLAELAWQVEDTASISWWDALIVAAARRSGAKILLSEDLNSGQSYLGVRVVDPFQVEPSEILDG